MIQAINAGAVYIDRCKPGMIRKPGNPNGVKSNWNAGPIVWPNATPPVTHAIARDRSSVVLAVEA